MGEKDRWRERKEERGGRWWVCSSYWCNWGSAVERLQCALVQRGGLNQRVPVHPGSRAGCRARDGGGGGGPGSEGWWREQERGCRDRRGNSRGDCAATQNTLRTQTCTFEMLPVRSEGLWMIRLDEEQSFYNHNIVSPAKILSVNQWH